MALKFIDQPAVYNASTDRLRFFATDRGLSVTFALSRTALNELDGARGIPDTKLVAAFERHKDRIREAASRAYLERGATREGIAVNVGHLTSAR